MAIEEAKKSTPEDAQPRPKVGAVAAKHGQLLGKDCRTAVMSNGKMNGQHEEFRLSTALSGADLDGATIYTTLEPCLNRGDPKVSCVDRLISVKVARVVIGAFDPDHRGNGLRKLAHAPSIEVSLFPSHLRADARLLIQDWKEHSENQQKKLVTNPERDALRERILEQKGKEVIWLNKKSNSHSSGTIVDCDDEVAVLRWVLLSRSRTHCLSLRPANSSCTGGCNSHWCSRTGKRIPDFFHFLTQFRGADRHSSSPTWPPRHHWPALCIWGTAGTGTTATCASPLPSHPASPPSMWTERSPSLPIGLTPSASRSCPVLPRLRSG